MASVYLVFTGSWEDYSLRRGFARLADAETYRDTFEEREEASICELEIDESIDPEAFFWQVSLHENQTKGTATRYESWMPDDAILEIVKDTLLPRYNTHFYKVWVQAPNMTIAHERGMALIATYRDA